MRSRIASRAALILLLLLVPSLTSASVPPAEKHPAVDAPVRPSHARGRAGIRAGRPPDAHGYAHGHAHAHGDADDYAQTNRHGNALVYAHALEHVHVLVHA